MGDDIVILPSEPFRFRLRKVTHESKPKRKDKRLRTQQEIVDQANGIIDKAIRSEMERDGLSYAEAVHRLARLHPSILRTYSEIVRGG